MRHVLGRFTHTLWGSRLCGQRLPILAYHRIANDPLDDLAVSPAMFAQQMALINRSGFQVLSLDEVILRLENGEDLRHSLALTFDDGYADFLDFGLPILRAFEFTATIFVVTGKLGTMSNWHRRSTPGLLLEPPALHHIQQAGVKVGSHSASHSSLVELTDAELARELHDSRVALENLLHEPVKHFSYPFGRWSSRERQAVIEAGYESACAIGGFWGCGYETNRFELQRFVVRRNYTLFDFQMILSSLIRFPLVNWPWERIPLLKIDKSV